MRKCGCLALLLFMGSVSAVAQQKICDCSPFFSPLMAADFESFFDPSLISSKRITDVKIFITSGRKNIKSKTDTALKIMDQKYVQQLYTFNNDGFAIHSRTFYNGKQTYYNSYNRDRNNNIVQSVTEYFDSTGKISADSRPEITDYTFDQYGDLAKRKKRDLNGAVLPDDKSEYTITEYNDQGWKTKETTHYYWDWETPPNRFTTAYYTYANKGKIETAKTYDNKKLYLTTTTNYDDNGAPTSISSFNHFMNKLAFKKVFKYDAAGRLIKYVQTSGGGGGSECQDKGNFSNEFKYNSEGLLIEQRHLFANTVCILQFEYR